jgi:FkbM family methyltransferase
MNWLHKIYPLWLREKIYFHLIARTNLSSKNQNGFALEFAPVKMHALLPTDYGHRQIASLGFYELDLSRRISSLAKEGGLLVDVGANAGYFTCLWAALNAQNEVYSFEPSPRNLAMVRQNISVLANPQRVKIFDHAIGKEAGTLNFDIGPEDQTGWGGLANSASTRTLRVKVCRLDDLAPPGKQISVLKIDTEGADTWVLYGAEKLLREKRISHIFFEANLVRMQQLGIHPGEAKKYLNDLGYAVHSLGADEFYSLPR